MKARWLPSLIVAFLAAPILADSRAILYDEQVPGAEPRITRILSDSVKAAGYSVDSIDADGLNKPGALKGVALLVIPNARSLPVSTIPSVSKYLESGNVIACGVPMAEGLITRPDGMWLTQEDYEKRLATIRPQTILVDFAKEDLNNWTRATNSTRDDTTAIEAHDGRTFLHVQMPSMTGWDTRSRSFDRPLPPGQTLTCFRAKSGPDTRQMCIEWQEQDGSRWIATVNLTTQWKDYALPPSAFSAWQPPKERGGPADHLHVENAKKLAVGLAFSHTDVERGAHEYWIGSIGTAQHPLGDVPQKAVIPAIEGLSPGFIAFDVNGAGSIRTNPMQAIVSQLEVKAPPSMLALHPRPGGAGFKKGRPWRWQSLLEARANEGDFRGTVAALCLTTNGAVRVSMTPRDPAFYEQPAIGKMITEIAVALRRGGFLYEAGANHYTAFEGESIDLGAETRGTTSGDYSVRTSVIPRGVAEAVYTQTVKLSGDGSPITKAWKPEQSPAGGFIVLSELLDGDRAIDRLSHELHVWTPKKQPKFIESRDGGFFLDGKTWKAHGVNYMPSSGIALANEPEMFEHWIGAAAYDPEIIDRDLKRVKSLGFNAVSAFIYRESMEAQNLLDFLRRCDELAIHVNLSLRPGTPIDYDWSQWKDLIEYYRLAQNDAVFAYDLAWEPTHWNHEFQERHYAAEWQKWWRGKYASDAPPVPTSDVLSRDGADPNLPLIYRAFLDDLLAHKYGQARQRVRQIDANHAVSFRMNILADPTANDPNMLAYDPWGLRDVVDIWAPEGYGRIGDWEWVKPGLFSAAYARACDPNKPFIWAEMGYSAWNTFTMRDDPQRLDFQARFYRNVYRLLRESGSDGIFFWWYPGGFRVGERSDFGIINPDGTDRPVTKVIREEAQSFLNAAKPEPDTTIEINRNLDPRGVHGVYETVKEKYWNTIETGHFPALKWSEPPAAPQAP